MKAKKLKPSFPVELKAGDKLGKLGNLLVVSNNKKPLRVVMHSNDTTAFIIPLERYFMLKQALG